MKNRSAFSLLFLTENLWAKKSAEGLLSLPICDIMGITKSLPPGGRWHAKRDGRSPRDFGFGLNVFVTHSPSVAYGASSLPEGAFGYVPL